MARWFSGPRRKRLRRGTGSQAALLAGYVHAAGARHVFGYPGESVIDFMELIVAARIDPGQYEAQF